MDPEDETLNTPTGDSSSPASEPQAAKPGEAPATPPAEPKSLDDVAARFAADSAPADGTEPAPVEGDEAQENAEEGGKEPAGDEDEEASSEPTDESLTDPAKLPPFHEHPRWKELVAERDSLRGDAEKARALEQYCSSNRIQSEDLKNAIEVAALLQSDPQKAYERLAPIVQGLESLLGVRLTPELEAELESGKLTPEQARAAAKQRAELEMFNRRKAAFEQEQRQQALNAITTAVHGWTSLKQQKDLSFKPRATGAPFGLYEAVDARFSQLVTLKPPQTPAEAVALAEQAYNDVKPSFSVARSPAPPTRRLSSDRTSTRTKNEPKSLDEVAMAATGYKWSTNNGIT